MEADTARSGSKSRSAELVSVVVPTYNRAELVARSVQSALHQTHEHLEVIVVDDASTDDTRSVLAAIADPRLRVVRLESNEGQSRARNRGIGEAKGRYVAFLDSDDEWLPDKIDRQLLRFQAADGPGATYTGMWVDDGTSRHDELARVDGWAFEEFLALPGPITTTGLMFDSAAVGDELFFDEAMGCAVEGDLLIRTSRHHAVGRVSEPLYVRHIHEGEQISRETRCYARTRRQILEKYADDFRLRPHLAAKCLFRLALTERKVGDYAGARRTVIEAAHTDPGNLRLRLLGFLASLGVLPLRLGLDAYTGAGRMRAAFARGASQ
jgi:glycosyltransferase involved in cell wall biosynthesis